MTLAAEIESFARSRGAELFGVTSAEPFETYLGMVSELESSHGLRKFPISKQIDRARGDPKNLLPSAESVIVLGVPYKLEISTDDSPSYQGPHVNISRYWRHRSAVIAGLGDSIAEFLRAKGFEAKHGQHPLKAAAARAGLGHLGKNTILYTRGFGSWIALVAVVTNARLEPAEVSPKDICGKCQRCIEACPTGAIYEPYKQDPLRCRTTIFHPKNQDMGEIADSLREKMGHWLIGCEICQDACPRNRKVKPREVNTAFDVKLYDIPLPDKAKLPLPQLLQMLDGEVSNYFQRYAAICIGNMAGAEEALPELNKLLSAEDPLVQKYARWAIDRIEGR